jgi:hypothetical protein
MFLPALERKEEQECWGIKEESSTTIVEFSMRF